MALTCSSYSSPTPTVTPSLRWIIQKFGGTSVGKFIDNIAEQVVP